MAGTAINRVQTAASGSDVRALIVQFNNLVASFDGVLAKLDADAGVTDTNYAATWGTQYSQIKTQGGATVSDP